MSQPNPKNLALQSPAAMDLGLGSQLMAQANAIENERKKKINQLTPQTPLLSSAAQSLFGGT